MKTKERDTKVLKLITDFCLSSTSTNLIEMADAVMSLPEMPMIGALHHPMIAGILVSAYRNATGRMTNKDVEEAIRRGSAIPAGSCAGYGADGAAIACGVAMSIILKTTPLAGKDVERSITHMMTSRALAAIANNRGARCCKRSTFDVLQVAIYYFQEALKVNLEQVPTLGLKCKHSTRFAYCNKENCRYFSNQLEP